jgi:hypothetical protein
MDKTIRLVERDFLDKEYTTFKILNRDENLAVGHMLKVAGDYWRDQRRVPDEQLASARTMFVLMLAGLGHCVRWIVAGRDRKTKLSKATWQEMDREALDFLVWGMRYQSLSIDHICWSRRILQASVDMANKIIEFFPNSGFDPVFLLSQRHDLQQTLDALYNALPTEQLGRDFQLWRKHFKIVEGGFDFSQELAGKLPSYPAVADWLQKCLLPNVDGTQDLGGYSLDEFRHFFATLFINCNFWMWTEDGFDDAFGPVNDFGTSMFTLPQSSMMSWLQKMSGLNIRSIKAIVAALTFDASDMHSSLMIRPFVLSSNKRLFLLPRLIALADPGRMLVGAMNKGVGRPIYAALIESASRAALSEIASMFRAVGLEVWQEKKVTDDNGRELTPD